MMRFLLAAMVFVLGVAPMSACKKKAPPTVIEIITTDAIVWEGNHSGAAILLRPTQGTKLTTSTAKDPPPPFWVVTTENGQGIVYAKDAAVAP